MKLVRRIVTYKRKEYKRRKKYWMIILTNTVGYRKEQICHREICHVSTVSYCELRASNVRLLRREVEAGRQTTQLDDIYDAEGKNVL
jgi:hypothetical protein